MKPFKAITDPAAFQLLADETRRRVIYLLRAKEMTVSQIAAELDLTPQAIYHHIRKLKDADMVEVAREERVDHFIETYYRATAEVFNLSHGEGASPESMERTTEEVLKTLPRLGFHVEANPQAVEKLADLVRRMEAFGVKSEWMERAGELEDVDFMTKQEVAHFAKVLSMSDEEFNEYLKLTKEMRRVLRSTLVEIPVAVAKKR